MKPDHAERPGGPLSDDDVERIRRRAMELIGSRPDYGQSFYGPASAGPSTAQAVPMAFRNLSQSGSTTPTATAAPAGFDWRLPPMPGGAGSQQTMAPPTLPPQWSGAAPGYATSLFDVSPMTGAPGSFDWTLPPMPQAMPQQFTGDGLIDAPLSVGGHSGSGLDRNVLTRSVAGPQDAPPSPQAPDSVAYGAQSVNNWPSPIGPQAVIDHEYLRPLMDIGRYATEQWSKASPGIPINIHTEADEPQLIRARLSQPDMKLPITPQSQSIPGDDVYERFRYDPAGPTTRGMIGSDPFGSFRALEIGDRAERVAESEYPGRSISDNEGDAFKHALWSYKMTLRHGPDWAKKFTDAHERNSSPDRSRVMDIYNNQVGRALALDPRNWGRPAEEVIREALKDGRLQLRPFSIRPRSPHHGIW